MSSRQPFSVTESPPSLSDVRSACICATRFRIRTPLTSSPNVVSSSTGRRSGVGSGNSVPSMQKRTDKAPTYRKAIHHENRHRDLQFDSNTDTDKRWRNTRIESDHAALRRLLGYRQGFRSLRSASSTLRRIEDLRTIKNNQIGTVKPGLQGEIAFALGMFGLAARAAAAGPRQVRCSD